MNRIHVRFAAAFALLLAAVAAFAQDEGPVFVTEVEGIAEYRLENGMKVLLMPDASRPTTTVNVTYFVGSKHESYGESGMAHLLEHLVFMGTPEHENIKQQITERGGFANGTTWLERTNYFQTLPAEDENLEWAIRMEADRMVNSFIAADDLASEMTVVRNEFEIGENSPFRVLLQRVMATAYEWHAYGRSTIGARADLENVPIERLQRFYRQYYQPDNAMVIVSGKFETERALELIQNHFGAIPAPARDLDNALWDTYTREPYQDGPREVTVRRSGSTQTLMAAYHVPSALHEDFAAVEALAFVLGDAPSGRLHKALVEPGLASDVGAFALRLPEPSLLLTYVNLPADADLDEAERVLTETLAGLDASPPGTDEVQRAVSSLTANMERTLNDSQSVGIGLSEWAATGDWRMLFLHRDRLEQIEAADVAEAASTYLVRDNRTLGRFIPDSEPQRAIVEEAPEPEALLAGYTGRESRSEGEVFEATPDNIEARVQRYTMDTGAEVALLPKSTRGERVRGTITMRIGTLETLMDTGSVPAATASMLSRGSENLTRQEISDRIDELQAGLNVGGSTSVSINIDTTRENLMEVIELIAEIARNPSFPESELEEYRRQALTGLDRASDDPASVASRQLSLYSNDKPASHPDYVPSFEEARARIEALSTEQLRAFHERFYGFGEATTAAFVGDFDPEALKAKLDEQFGDWTPQVRFERRPDPYTPVEPARLVEQLDDKASAVLIAGHGFPMSDTHPDYVALELAGHMLGGGFLSSRLGDRIRNQEGLSYAVAGGFNAHPIDESGSFFAFAMFAPENRDRLEEVLNEELVKVVEDGFTQDELDSAKTGYLQQLVLQRSDDGALAGQLSGGLYFDRDLFWQAEREAAIRALTLDEVNAAVREWLDPDALVVAMAGDFSGESEPASDVAED
ncbi:insulinase family protein [Wenzhouxiangella sp. XN79A]|uniref:M16 family metallopeptidase n=1 Tax=Wenzhouxiangella sp. XN79A TaxID=2724193 RepID=UPI00144A5A41|nr:pitrilysin family protein [Wenzhouxiangella sp. XN79A]NKI35446.1 insulinase family protein [Wenzhouxiangella sp. XN79A]